MITPATIFFLLAALTAGYLSDTFSARRQPWPARAWILIAIVLAYGAGESASWPPFAPQ